MNAHAPFPPVDEPNPLHSLDAEQAFLGALLYDNDLADRVDFLKPEHFYDPVHGRIYAACVRLIAAGRLADAVVLKGEMASDPGLQELGVSSYLARLLESASDNAAAVEYAKMVRDLSDRRILKSLFDTLLVDVGDTEARELVERAEERLAEISGSAVAQSIRSPGDALRQVLADPIKPIPCGLTDFDDYGVLIPGVCIVGARSSMGKSSLVVDLVHRAARRDHASVLISNEMTDRQVSSRLAGAITGVEYEAIHKGRLDAEQRDDVSKAADELDTLPLTIVEAPGVSLGGLRALIRRWKREQEKAGRKIGVVGIDYLQNIHAEGNSLYEKMSVVALGLQTIGLALDVCLVVACQLSRAAESEKDKHPSLRHLRDSGKIEEIADSVLLLYRDSYYAAREPECADIEEEQQRRHRASSLETEVDVAKNRHGAIGKFSLWADLKTNRYDNWSGR